MGVPRRGGRAELRRDVVFHWQAGGWLAVKLASDHRLSGVANRPKGLLLSNEVVLGFAIVLASL